MPSGSAASGFPFTQASTVDDNGVLFGVDEATEAPVVLDRFKWNAGHSVLAGVTGSGKSFHSKLLLLRSALVYEDLYINIVDPKPEYGEIESVLEEYASVERYEFEGSISEDEQSLIQGVEQAYQDAQKTESKSIVVVDEAHRLLKKENGASSLSTLVREARSSNTAVHLITQTVGDFYRTEDGEDILKNVPCKVLFAHEKADNQPSKAFQLSTVAETSLYNLAKGDQDSTDYSQAILSVSNEFESEIKVEASTVETSIIENGEIPENSSESSEGFDLGYNATNTSEKAGVFERIKASIAQVSSRIGRASLSSISWPSFLDSSNSRSRYTTRKDSSWRDKIPEISLGIPQWIKDLTWAATVIGGGFLTFSGFVLGIEYLGNQIGDFLGLGGITTEVLTFLLPFVLMGISFSLIDAYNAVKEA
jgi:hypothetical protein